MAFSGGHRNPISSRSEEPGKPPLTVRIGNDIKTAQTAKGVLVPAGYRNDSQYGASGEWRKEGSDELVKLPPFRFTFRGDPGGYRAHVRLTVRDPKFPIFSLAGSLHHYASSYGSRNYRDIAHNLVPDMGRFASHLYSPEWEKVERGIQTIAGSYNYDRSESQTDYFDYGFHLDVVPDPAIIAASHQKSEQMLTELTVAFPDLWARIVAEAAAEEAQARRNPDWGLSTNARNALTAAVERAAAAVAQGTIVIPFNPERRGWGKRHSAKGTRYWMGEKKLKQGQLVGRVSDTAGGPIGTVVTVGPNEFGWTVYKNSGGRGGRYTTSELVGKGVALSLEEAILAAEKSMGISEVR